MKHLLLSLVALLLPCMAFAEGEVTHLSIEHSDGKSTHIVLSETPVMTFDGGDMLVKSANFDLSIPRSEVAYFHFTKQTPSAVESVADDSYFVRYTSNTLTVSGADVTAVEVYDLDGRRAAFATSADGCVTVDLSACPKGVYIVVVKDHPSFKVAVR